MIDWLVFIPLIFIVITILFCMTVFLFGYERVERFFNSIPTVSFLTSTFYLLVAHFASLGNAEGYKTILLGMCLFVCVNISVTLDRFVKAKQKEEAQKNN